MWQQGFAHAGMLLLKQLWMPEMPNFAMSPLGLVILMRKTPPIGWKRLRRGWGSLWQGGCPLLFRESGKHQCAAGSLACALVQATLGVSGAGGPSCCVVSTHVPFVIMPFVIMPFVIAEA